MYCTSCGRRIDDASAFCPGCGRPLRGVRPAGPGPARRVAPAAKPRRRKKSPAALIVLVLLLAAAGLFWLFRDRLPAREAGARETARPADGEALSETAGDLIPHFDERYYINTLSDEDLDVFCRVYEAVSEYRETCALPSGTSDRQLKLCWYLLQLECPELFHVDYARPLNYTRGAGFTLELSGNYVLRERDYRSALKDCREALDQIAAEGEALDEWGREELVFRALAENCRYDTQADFCATAYGALIGGRAKCDGISLALKWALEELGIPSLIVTGTSLDDGVGHAWNMVRLDGHWYNVDLTPSVRRSGETQDIPELVYHSFNVSDAWMEEDYSLSGLPEGLESKPRCRTMDQSWYVRSGDFVFAGEDPMDLISGRLRRIADDGAGSVELQFESRREARAFFDALDGELQRWIDREAPDARFGSYSSTLLNDRFLLIRFEP